MLTDSHITNTYFCREATYDYREATYDYREAPYGAGEAPCAHTCISYIVGNRTFLPTPLTPLTPEGMVTEVKCSRNRNRFRCQRCQR